MSLGVVSHYELLERIGSGAESTVYRARDRRGGRIVAIKDLVIEDGEKRKYLNHVANEYSVLRKLHAAATECGRGGDGIVKVHALIRSGLFRRRKRRSMVMDYVQGEDLRRERRYPLPQLIDFFRQVAGVLSFMHSAGYVHGDVKPENVMVGPRGRVTMVDFGFSCPAATQAASVRGTRDYMAPEQVRRGLITERTDIYNLGATMYFILTGRYVPALIAPAGDNGLFISGEEMSLTPVREWNPQVPQVIADMVEWCCARDPLERPSAMQEVHRILVEAGKATFGRNVALGIE